MEYEAYTVITLDSEGHVGALDMDTSMTFNYDEWILDEVWRNDYQSAEEWHEAVKDRIRFWEQERLLIWNEGKVNVLVLRMDKDIAKAIKEHCVVELIPQWKSEEFFKDALAYWAEASEEEARKAHMEVRKEWLGEG